MARHKKIPEKYIFGEVDQVQQKREKILLDKSKDEESSDDEATQFTYDESEDDQMSEDDEAEVMARAMRMKSRGTPLQIESEDEDDDEDDEDESDSENTSTHNTSVNSQDDDEAEDDEDEEAGDDEERDGFSSDEELEAAMLGKKKKKEDENERGLSGWSKNEFYQEKRVRKGSMKELYEQAMEEEANVKEVQKKKAKRLRNADFEDTFLAAKTGDQSSSASRATSAESASKTTDAGKADGELTDADKLKIVVEDSPELLEFMSDLQQKVKTVKDQVFPLMSKVKSGQLKTQNGLSYLEVKFHVLLSYCINVVFYMLLKAEGKPIKGHPVVAQLVLLRTMLEKIKPIDEKLKTQVDKLITIATSKQAKDAAPVSSSSSSDMQHKPNLDNMVSKTQQGESAEGDSAAATGAYVPPSFIPIEFDDKAIKARKKEIERLEKRLQKSSMARSLRDVLGEEPEEMFSVGAEHDKQNVTKDDRFAHDLRDFEEDTFTRKTLSKEEKKKLKRHATSLVDELADLDNFDDLVKMNTILDKKPDTNRVTLLQYLDDLEGAQEHLNAGSADAETTSYVQKTGSFNLSQGLPAIDNKRKRDNDDNDDPEAKKKRKAIRDKQDRKLERKKNDDTKRAATEKMVKNRGLTPSRNKDKKNPRVKLKTKYAQKTASMNAMMSRGKDAGGSYSGEKSFDKGAIGSRKLG